MNQNLQNKNIAVLGLGVSNVAVISYLLRCNPKHLTVFDTRANPPFASSLPLGIDVRLGPLDGKLLSSYDLIVIAPGLSQELPAVAQAASAGVKIVGDIELFAKEAQAPVIGITGSNGKSTVTALLGFMAQKAHIKAAVGANFGTPVFDVLSPEVELYILELSSFELETTSSLKLKGGVILNVSEDHLDRYHGSMDEYAAAKRRIFMHCDHIVSNRDDQRTWPGDNPGAISFGLDDQDYGRKDINGDTYLCVKGEPVLNVKDMIICGVHNEENALAAMALADIAGIPRSAQVQALRTFPGLPHRCRLVRTLDGVTYFNDSKATNVASTEAAIKGLYPRFPQGLILLAGGLGKGQDFSPLRRYLGREVKAVFCFGRDGNQILNLDPVYTHSALNLRQALHAAQNIAKPGQAVVLSPACASFDQFKGFEERGRIFTSLVGALEGKEQQ